MRLPPDRKTEVTVIVSAPCSDRDTPIKLDMKQIRKKKDCLRMLLR